MPTSLLLAHEFPPARGGVARVMGEIARRYPAGSLVVSTGSERAGPASAEGIAAEVDRLPLSPRQLRTLPGLLLLPVVRAWFGSVPERSSTTTGSALPSSQS